jgi:hypothetical protein
MARQCAAHCASHRRQTSRGERAEKCCLIAGYLYQGLGPIWRTQNLWPYAEYNGRAAAKTLSRNWMLVMGCRIWPARIFGEQRPL